jgi:hypothetical protein
MAATSLMLIGTQALCADPPARPRTSRHQIADCITKRMSASRTVSFNEATKACKDQLKAQGENLTSNTSANSSANTSAKPVSP